MRAKKHLGQNFLTSNKFLGDVVRAASIAQDDVVVEVGPGKGSLTKHLLESCGKLIAIEKDPELVMLIKEKFKEEIKSERFTLIEGDVLDVDIAAHTDKPYLLVANIPYYITGMILRHFLSAKVQPKSMTLVVQKEVASRIASRDAKQSVLSLSVNAYGKPRVIGKIPARYFTPKPKVDSAILHIDNISRDFFKEIDEEKFFEFIKTGFEHKRKKLIKNLEVLYPKTLLKECFESCSVNENSRAEELSRELWKKLYISCN